MKVKLLDTNSLSRMQLDGGLPGTEHKRQRLFRAIRYLTGAALYSFSSLALGLGLGEIQSSTFIGQPLKANIELVSLDRDIELDRLIVRQVTPEEAAKLGVDLVYSPVKFQFRIDTSATVPFVTVESKEPVKEPYINLLVELRWPNGVVYREYPLLLDPPPKTPVVSARAKTESVSAPSQAVTSSPKPKKDNSKPIAGAQRLKLEPLATAEGKYKVKAGDTLSKIAERWREGTDRGIYDTMQWLHQNNLHAFTNQNIDLLRAGAVLNMPDLSAYSVDNKVPTADEQAKTVQIKEPTEGTIKPSSTEELEVQVKENSVRHVDIKNQAQSRGLLTVGTVSQDDNARELIDMLVRENETLRARMEKIENSEYLETLKQLIILQRQQISDLRSRIGVSDTGNNKDVEQLLERIGVAQENGEIKNQVEAVLNDAEANLNQKTENSQVELASENVAAQKLEDESIAPVKVDPVLSAPLMANQSEKSWLIWLVVGGGAAIIAAFLGLLIYYRKVVRGTEDYLVDEVDEDELDELFDSLGEDTPKATAVKPKPASKAVIAEHAAVDESIAYDGEESTVYNIKQSAEDEWLGETAELSERDLIDMDAAMREVQEAFDDLLLDESILSELEKDSALEALTEELPKQDNRAAGKAKKNKKKGKVERRSDDELKMSIAEKMAQYNPEEYRQEIEKLGLLELDEFGDFEEEQDEIDTAVYRAMMFCEFKKFDKARELIQSMLESNKDERLDSALEQIDGIETLSKSSSKQAG